MQQRLMSAVRTSLMFLSAPDLRLGFLSVHSGGMMEDDDATE